MYVGYGGHRSERAQRTMQYRCSQSRNQIGGTDCQTIGGKRIDQTVVGVFLEVVRPAGLEALKRIEEQWASRQQALRHAGELQVEKAEYEAKRAERQFQAVEPENRLVARELERRWNDKLNELERVRQQAQSARGKTAPLSEEEMTRARQLAQDVSEAARRLGLSKSYVVYLIKTNRLEAMQESVRKQRRWRINLDSAACKRQTEMFSETATAPKSDALSEFKKSLRKSAAWKSAVAGLVKTKPLPSVANAIRPHVDQNYCALWRLRRQCRSLTKLETINPRETQYGTPQGFLRLHCQSCGHYRLAPLGHHDGEFAQLVSVALSLLHCWR